MWYHEKSTEVRINFLKWLYKTYGATVNVRIKDLLANYKTPEGQQVWRSYSSVWGALRFLETKGWINIRYCCGRAQSYYIRKETIKTIIMNE